MSRAALMEQLEAHEAEIVALLSPLYAEVRHWEGELARTRKAKRAAAQAIEARGQQPKPV